MRVILKNDVKKFAIFRRFCKKMSVYRKKYIQYARFFKQGNLRKRASIFFVRKFWKSEYYFEHLKFSEDFGREYFKILVIKK